MVHGVGVMVTPAVKPKSTELPRRNPSSGTNGPNGGNVPLNGVAETSLTCMYWICAPTPTLNQSVSLMAMFGLALTLRTSDSAL